MTVRAKQSGTPIRLRLGTYRVTLSTELDHGLQESNWLDSFDKRADDVRTEQVTVTLSPPDYTATVPVSFGQVDVAFFQRGSAGGYTAYWADGDGRATLGFKSMLNLLDNLHDHGVVSKVDAQDNFTIRPMISWKAYMRRQTNTINYSTELPLAQGIKFDL